MTSLIVLRVFRQGHICHSANFHLQLLKFDQIIVLKSIDQEKDPSEP